MPGHLERIRVFHAVAEAGSFAGAARRLGMSASAVTRAVAELEDHLGVQLFLRTTRKVSLSGAGEEYLHRTLAAANALAEADDMVRRQQEGLSGTLRISCPLSFGTRFLPGIVAGFREQYPQIALQMQLTDRFVDITAGDYDMALRISGPPTDKSTIWRKICAVPRHLFAAPDYLKDAPPLRDPEDLAAHKCLVYSSQADGELWHFSKGDRSVPLRVRSMFGCNNGDLLGALAARGEGIALLPDFILDQQLARGEVVPVLPDWETPPLWLTAFYPPYRKLPRAVDRFTAVTEAAMAGRSMG